MNNSATNAKEDFLMFIAPTKTITYKKNWICQGVPCKVENIEIEHTSISPFNVQSIIKIPNEIIENEFITLVELSKAIIFNILELFSMLDTSILISFSKSSLLF